MHDPAAERILVHLAPTMGKAKVYGRLAVGPTAAPVASTLTPASERAAAIFLLQPGLSAQGDSIAVMPFGALWVAESARTTSATIALASVTSAGALMPERSGEPNRLLVMVLW